MCVCVCVCAPSGVTVSFLTRHTGNAKLPPCYCCNDGAASMVFKKTLQPAQAVAMLGHVEWDKNDVKAGKAGTKYFAEFKCDV